MKVFGSSEAGSASEQVTWRTEGGRFSIALHEYVGATQTRRWPSTHQSFARSSSPAPKGALAGAIVGRRVGYPEGSEEKVDGGIPTDVLNRRKLLRLVANNCLAQSPFRRSGWSIGFIERSQRLGSRHGSWLAVPSDWPLLARFDAKVRQAGFQS